MQLSHEDYDWMYGAGEDQGNFFGWLFGKLRSWWCAQ